MDSTSFSSSAPDTALHTSPSTDPATKLMGSARENEEFMSIEEIRALLKLPGNNTLGAYNGLHTIGVGGFGAVYAAEEPGLERKLALKVLRPRYRDSRARIRAFIREARITAQIDHPNIVPVHRIGVFDDAGVYFSMKRIAGETLRAVLRKLKENRGNYRKKYSLPRLLDIFIGACQGVHYAHQNGILHCDLKPENLMVGDFGEVLVMDWGMARRLPGSEYADETDLPDEKEEQQMGGTPVYMAPEHLSLTSAEPTVRSDIYALGCVLYSILTWKSSPFEGAETLEEIQKKVVREKLIPPRRCAPESQAVPHELEAICLKAMARFPEKRYDSVAALIEDLQNYRDGLPVHAYDSSPVYKAGKFIFRRPLVPITFFLSLLVWCGFTLYTVINDYFYAESLKISAENTFRNGENRALQAKKRSSQLAGENMTLPMMQTLESAIAADIADAESDFKSTLDALERIPANYSNPRKSSRTAVQIFRILSELYHLTGNDRKLHSTAKLFNERWDEIFTRARENDPAFRRLFNYALSGTGTVQLINSPQSESDWYIEDASGEKVKDLNLVLLEHRNTMPVFQLQLPLGLYTVVVRSARSTTHRFPLRSSLTAINKVDLTLPSFLPQDMVFIPRGEFIHAPELCNNFRRRSFEGDFIIKRTEVTVAEYLEFWKSLKNQRLQKLYASYYFGTKDSMQSYPAWDKRGNLLRPGLLPEHPVTGISAYAAEAFCHWKSQQLKRVVTLPTRAQWSKAAGGIDGTQYAWGNTYKSGMANINTGFFKPVGTTSGDRSIYGVLDLSGNVREFVRIPREMPGPHGVFAIAGGSYFSPPAVSPNANIVYTPRGGNDVGFRYVSSIEKKQTLAAAEK